MQKNRAKATATVKTADSKKQTLNIDDLNASIKKSLADKKQSADSKKQTASNSKKQSADKKQNSKKQSATADNKKLSAYKNACRMYASLNELADADSIALVHELTDAIQHDDFHVVCKDTTSCALFIVDNNNNTVCNVYDCLRIQFTTVQARKYRDALLKDSRFYTHLYKNNEFISCKCSTYDDFVSAMQFVYNVYMNSKQTATATEQTAEQQEAK